MAAKKATDWASLDEETKPKPRGGCSVATMLANMHAHDASIVDKIIRDPTRPLGTVHQAVRSRRTDCPGEWSFRQHRRGRCACGRTS